MKKILFLLFAFASMANGQQYVTSGMVRDSETGLGLPYTNIRVMESNSGTASNKKGAYELRLPKGKYLFVASYIGYYSDTISVDLNRNIPDADFSLKPSEIELQEITVTPGVNPAVGIIQKAIQRKKLRDSLIYSYELEAYTKGIIRTNQEISSRGSGVNLSLGGNNDTTGLFISGIIENQSRGFFKKPDKFKEIISARKQSANLPSSVNVLTGGRFIQNFYDDNIFFLGNELKGPLADNALSYYYYYLEGMDAINDVPVYKIRLMPDNNTDPGFVGNLYITDSTFDLIKVDLKLNRAANTGGIFDTINVFQQFSRYDGIYMPVDYRLYAGANILGLAKIGFELNTILYDYRINEPISDDQFNKAVITVMPEADERDSLFWTGIQTIPNTDEEQSAYHRIDSLDKVPVSFWDNFSFLSTRIDLNRNFSFSGPLSLYHFNNVEGHSIDLGFFGDDLLNDRLTASLQLNYGFADKKVKNSFSTSYLFEEYRTGRIELNVYNRTKVLFDESVGYNEFTSTILALFSKYQFRDYYYSRGGGIFVSDEISPVLRLNAGYDYMRDMSTDKKTDYSFFGRNKTYKKNQHISDAELNIISAGFRIDFRNYIEDGLYRSRITEGKSYIIFDGGLRLSRNNIIPTTHNFTIYDAGAGGIIRSFGSTFLDYNLNAMYSNGEVPYQMLYLISGNINYTVVNNSFRTLNVNEGVGDRVFTALLEYNFRDELFRMLRIPLLKNSELQLKTFLNAALSSVSSASSRLPEVNIIEFKHPFYEAGFSIGHVLFPIELSFAWKLNYTGHNNFRFAIGSVIY